MCAGDREALGQRHTFHGLIRHSLPPNFMEILPFAWVRTDLAAGGPVPYKKRVTQEICTRGFQRTTLDKHLCKYSSELAREGQNAKLGVGDVTTCGLFRLFNMCARSSAEIAMVEIKERAFYGFCSLHVDFAEIGVVDPLRRLAWPMCEK